MTPFEIAVVLLLLVVLVAVGGGVLQVRAIAREVRGESREARADMSQAVSTLTDLERAELQALRESIQGRSTAAVETIKQAEAVSKPHRPVWAFSSREQTNGETITFLKCTVSGCRDVLRVGPDDPDPLAEAQD